MVTCLKACTGRWQNHVVTACQHSAQIHATACLVSRQLEHRMHASLCARHVQLEHPTPKWLYVMTILTCSRRKCRIQCINVKADVHWAIPHLFSDLLHEWHQRLVVAQLGRNHTETLYTQQQCFSTALHTVFPCAVWPTVHHDLTNFTEANIQVWSNFSHPKVIMQRCSISEALRSNSIFSA